MSRRTGTVQKWNATATLASKRVTFSLPARRVAVPCAPQLGPVIISGAADVAPVGHPPRSRRSGWRWRAHPAASRTTGRLPAGYAERRIGQSARIDLDEQPRGCVDHGPGRSVPRPRASVVVPTLGGPANSSTPSTPVNGSPSNGTAARRNANATRGAQPALHALRPDDR